MRYQIRFTEEARDDLLRLYAFALERSEGDWAHVAQVADTLDAGFHLLQVTPFIGRKAGDQPLQRELVIGFGSAGYVALYQIEGDGIVTVIAVRHQREDDYH